jgi:pimeloyl-ACP methyl ester carboxylesterase
MEKIFIKNRNNKKLCVLLEKSNNQQGLVFIEHGLGGFKEQKHIQIMADSFRETDYTVVRFDTTSTLGDSEGSYGDATLTNYYQDLEDVIKWAEDQEWYQEPFVLAGHSLGSFSIILYTQKHPNKVKALAPISTVISGKTSNQRYDKEKVKEWEETGWRIEPSASKPGVIKKLNWPNFRDDIFKYDVLLDAHKITQPILLVTGSEDHGTPYEDQKLLYDKVSGDKELYVIEGSGHNFRTPEHLQELKEFFDNWIKNKLK